jgi:hypothetical protein
MFNLKNVAVLSSLVSLASLSAVSLATAQVDSRCNKARDKVGCTCAVQNGGGFRPDGTWYHRLHNQPVSENYIACMKKRGRA